MAKVNNCLLRHHLPQLSLMHSCTVNQGDWSVSTSTSPHAFVWPYMHYYGPCWKIKYFIVPEGTKRETICVCVQMLPCKKFSDRFIEVVMVSEWAAIIYAQHQEKHGATDRQIPRWQEKEIIPFTASNHIRYTHKQRHTDKPEGVMDKSLSSFLPTSFPQLCLSRWAHKTEVPGSLTSSKQLSVRESLLYVLIE